MFNGTIPKSINGQNAFNTQVYMVGRRYNQIPIGHINSDRVRALYEYSVYNIISFCRDENGADVGSGPSQCPGKTAGGPRVNRIPPPPRGIHRKTKNDLPGVLKHYTAMPNFCTRRRTNFSEPALTITRGPVHRGRAADVQRTGKTPRKPSGHSLNGRD